MRATRFPFVFTLAVFLLNLLLGSWVAPATGDGYAELVNFREELAPRPQHLLLTGTWRLLHGAVASWPGATPLRTIVISNAACGALALGFAMQLGLAAGIARGALTTALALLAVTSAWWTHARDAESTMIAHALLAASAWAAFEGRRAFASALFTAAAAMAANVLTTLPMLLLLDRAARDHGGARPHSARGALSFAAMLVLPFFALAAWRYAANREVIEAPFFTWIAHHSAEEMMGAVPKGASPLAALRAGAGLLRCFVPLEAGVPAAAKLVLTGRGEEAGDLEVGALASFAAAAVLAIVVFALFAKAAFAAPPVTPAPRTRDVVRACAAGLAGSALGCWIWLGSDPQFWLPILPFVFVGAAAAFGVGGRPASRFAIVAAAFVFAALFTLNAPWATPSLVRPEGGSAWRSAGEFCKEAEPGDLLLTKDTAWSFYAAERCEGLRAFRLLYDTNARGSAILEEVGALIDSTRASGGRVFLEDLCEAESLADLGFWENMATAREMPRETLCAGLAARGSMESVTLDRAFPIQLLR